MYYFNYYLVIEVGQYVLLSVLVWWVLSYIFISKNLASYGDFIRLGFVFSSQIQFSRVSGQSLIVILRNLSDRGYSCNLSMQCDKVWLEVRKIGIFTIFTVNGLPRLVREMNQKLEVEYSFKNVERASRFSKRINLHNQIVIKYLLQCFDEEVLIFELKPKREPQWRVGAQSPSLLKKHHKLLRAMNVFSEQSGWYFEPLLTLGIFQTEFQSIDQIITAEDLYRSGRISGAIGSGKTTLRLHLMRFLIEHGHTLIDFDFKGEAGGIEYFQGRGEILTLGNTLSINLFANNWAVSDKEYAYGVANILVEYLEGIEISPPQEKILKKAIYHTVCEEGGLHDFFTNIFYHAEQMKKQLNNNQELSAAALITKLDFLQNQLGSVFNQKKTSYTPSNLINDNLWINFSKINHISNLNHRKLIIQLVLYHLLLSIHRLPNREGRKIIFLDEAQLWLPNHKRGILSFLEEMITTMRYKGVSIIACGVAEAALSPILNIAEFQVKFRGDSETVKERYLCELSANSTNFESRLLRIHPFSQCITEAK